MPEYVKQTDKEEIQRLELKLGELAEEWRSSADQQKKKALVTEYRTTLRKMFALGYNSWLDIDTELPDELMPEEYISRRKGGLWDEAAAQYQKEAERIKAAKSRDSLENDPAPTQGAITTLSLWIKRTLNMPTRAMGKNPRRTANK